MKQYRLHVTTQFLNRLQDHAEDSLPAEAVALLFGQIDADDIRVQRVVILQNTSSSSKTSFSIDPEIQYRLYVEAEQIGDGLVCIFHSHPAPPFPSSRDHQNMRLNPVVWLIASKTTGTWISKAFVLDKDTPREIDIIQVP